MRVKIPRTALLPHGLAILGVGIAFLLASQFPGTSYLAQFTIFLLSVVAATWFGGHIPGWVAVALSTLAVEYAVEPPAELSSIYENDLYRMGIYFGAAVLTLYLTHIIRTNENALKQTEDHYRYLFDNNPFPMWICDSETLEFLAVNDAAIAYYRFSNKEFLTMKITDLCTPERLPGIIKHFSSPRSKVGYDGFWKHQRKDGSEMDVEVFSHEMVFDGKPAFQVLAVDVSDKMRVEAFARESESRLETIVENLSEGLIVTSLDRKFVHINQAAVEIFGLRSTAEFGSLTEFSSHFEICDLDGNVLPVEKWPLFLTTGGHPANAIDILVRRISGDWVRILRCRRSKIDDADGKPSMSIVTLNDVTDRKKAEQELRHSQKQLAGIIGSAMDAIITVDNAFNIVQFNAAAEIMFRCLAKDAIGLPLSRFVPNRLGIEKVRSPALESSLNAGGSVDSTDSRLGRRETGEEFPIEASISSVETDGSFFYTVFIRDITSRKAAIDALKLSEERYRDLVENAHDLIFTLDLDERYTSINQAVEQIIGYTQDEMLGMFFNDLLTPESVMTFREMLVAKMNGKDVTAYRIEMVTKDRRHLTLDINSWLVLDNGRPVGIQGIARDITERTQLEEKLRQSQKLESIGMLAGGVAHDFNNLLTVINGYSDLALRTLNEDDPIKHKIVQIKDAGTRASALTAQLLAFSRKQVLKPQVHNLNAVISHVETMLRRLIRESIELRTELDPDLWNIRADPGQIEQVIMNLTVNARDAMPDGGTLIIKTENCFLEQDSLNVHSTVQPGPFVRLKVTDCGSGMDEETVKRIFEPFFTTKEVGKGSGLGLSTVHGIIKQSGGDIQVRSKTGRGTTVEILFPRAKEAVLAASSTEDWHRTYSGNESILVVEDDENVRRLASDVLSSNGYNVLSANGGAEAISILDNYAEPIHMLLTDMVMPEMSGPVLQAQAATLRPNVKTLFMSGYSEEHRGSVGGTTAQFEFIEKPFTPNALTKKVREILDANIV